MAKKGLDTTYNSHGALANITMGQSSAISHFIYFTVSIIVSRNIGPQCTAIFKANATSNINGIMRTSCYHLQLSEGQALIYY